MNDEQAVPYRLTCACGLDTDHILSLDECLRLLYAHEAGGHSARPLSWSAAKRHCQTCQCDSVGEPA